MDTIRTRLDNLAANLDGDFMVAFAGIAEEIEEDASKADDGHDHCLRWLSARAELDEMLESVGLSR
jgi:hypothetical protein